MANYAKLESADAKLPLRKGATFTVGLPLHSDIVDVLWNGDARRVTFIFATPASYGAEPVIVERKFFAIGKGEPIVDNPCRFVQTLMDDGERSDMYLFEVTPDQTA